MRRIGHSTRSSGDQWWCRSGGVVAEYAIMCSMRVLPTPDAACKSWVHCRCRYREPSFAAARVSPCGQGKKVGLVSYSTTLTPPLGYDFSRSWIPNNTAFVIKASRIRELETMIQGTSPVVNVAKTRLATKRYTHDPEDIQRELYGDW